MSDGTLLIVGATSGIGLRLAETCAAAGREVIITGRDPQRTAAVAAAIRGAQPVRSLAVDLSRPQEIASHLAEVGEVRHLVVAAVDRDSNSVGDYGIEGALALVTIKLIGYTEVVHALATRLAADAAIVLFGGLAMRRPYPGSTTITTVNGGISSLVRTLAIELAPVRVNALHPGVIGDSPEWLRRPPGALGLATSHTLIGRLPTMDDVVGATRFLLENPAVNGINLELDGGWRP